MLSEKSGRAWERAGLAPLLWAEYDGADVLGRGGDGAINRDEVRPRECGMVLAEQDMAQESCGGSQIRATLGWERVEYPRGFWRVVFAADARRGRGG